MYVNNHSVVAYMRALVANLLNYSFYYFYIFKKKLAGFPKNKLVKEKINMLLVALTIVPLCKAEQGSFPNGLR